MTMNIYSASTIGRLVAILTIVFGIIIIIVPDIIAYMIGAFLIVIGILSLIKKVNHQSSCQHKTYNDTFLFI